MLCAGLLLPMQNSFIIPFSEDTTAAASAAVRQLSYDYEQAKRDSVFSDKNILLIVPHEDDDICLLGGLFEQYVEAGSKVSVLFTTNGDYYGGNTAQIRMDEALNALALVGIQENDVYFLGYGDQWEEQHIYHAQDNEALTSKGGFTHTYGTARHDAYMPNVLYTRNNYKNGLRSVIESLLPDTIFCIDFDGHRDHRALSLLFEEVMGQLLKDRADYTPTVLKGFGYSLAWYAADDFAQENISSTKNPTDKPYMTEVNYYNWADRIRFPVSSASLARVKEQSLTYQMLLAHASQNAAARGGRIINGDRVFWVRDTTSVLYRANLKASSGNAALLTDFRLIDTQDIGAVNCVFSGHVWQPDALDESKSVTVTLETPTQLREIRLYDNPSLSDNVLDAELTLSDGTSCTTGALHPNGSATVIPLYGNVTVDSFTVRILQTEGDGAGLAEIEAYETSPELGMRYVKLINKSDDFVYDYWIDPSGSERFTLYGVGIGTDLADDFDYTLDGDAGCRADSDGNDIVVTCPPGRSCILTVQHQEDETIYDTVRISNPSRAWRMLVKLLQQQNAAD